MPRKRLKFGAEFSVESLHRVQPRSHGRSPLRHRQQFRHRRAEPFCARFDLRREGREFLFQGQRRRILQVRAPHFHDLSEIRSACRERTDRFVHRWQQPFGNAKDGGDMHCRGKGIVGGLACIDVVVGVYGSHRTQRCAEYFIRAVGDDLIGVHVGLRAGSGLPDDEWKMICQFSRGDFACRPRDCATASPVDDFKFRIRERGGFFLETDRTDHFFRHAFAADGEVLQAALGLRAPVFVGGYAYFAHAVPLDTEFGFAHRSIAFSSSRVLPRYRRSPPMRSGSHHLPLRAQVSSGTTFRPVWIYLHT